MLQQQKYTFMNKQEYCMLQTTASVGLQTFA